MKNFQIFLGLLLVSTVAQAEDFDHAAAWYQLPASAICGSSVSVAPSLSGTDDWLKRKISSEVESKFKEGCEKLQNSGGVAQATYSHCNYICVAGAWKPEIDSQCHNECEVIASKLKSFLAGVASEKSLSGGCQKQLDLKTKEIASFERFAGSAPSVSTRQGLLQGVEALAREISSLDAGKAAPGH